MEDEELEDIYMSYKDLIDEVEDTYNTLKNQSDNSSTDYRWCSDDLMYYSLRGIAAEKIY